MPTNVYFKICSFLALIFVMRRAVTVAQVLPKEDVFPKEDEQQKSYGISVVESRFLAVRASRVLAKPQGF